MKTKKNIKSYLSIFLLFTASLISCRKSSFLDVKSNNALTVPTTIADMQALLDDDLYMNGSPFNSASGPTPFLGEAGSDNIDINYSDYINAPFIDQNVFIWGQTVYSTNGINSWGAPYRTVFYANTALDGLNKIVPSADQKAGYNNVLGSALFYRAYGFYQLAQLFAPVYDSNTAQSDLGIPIRLVADISIPTTRSTVAQSYNQIIADLQQSISVLPVIATTKTRPSKPAAYALLSKVYLAMQDYNDAYLYADSCLQLSNNLIDYNQIPATPSYPFKRMNTETLFYALLAVEPSYLYGDGIVDSTLYKSYLSNDLRKSLFFAPYAYGGGQQFRGSYDGSYYYFGGLATDEIYLIRAECNARKGNTSSAMNDLNTLLQKRFVTGTFVSFTATDATDALKKILVERRKELVMRGVRWTDLRRLNKEPQFAITISHGVNGKIYTLKPGDPRYVWPIPYDVIALTGIQQNPR